MVQAIVFTVNAQRHTYETCPVLLEQYREFEANEECAPAVCDGAAAAEVIEAETIVIE